MEETAHQAFERIASGSAQTGDIDIVRATFDAASVLNERTGGTNNHDELRQAVPVPIWAADALHAALRGNSAHATAIVSMCATDRESADGYRRSHVTNHRNGDHGDAVVTGCPTCVLEDIGTLPRPSFTDDEIDAMATWWVDTYANYEVLRTELLRLTTNQLRDNPVATWGWLAAHGEDIFDHDPAEMRAHIVTGECSC